MTSPSDQSPEKEADISPIDEAEQSINTDKTDLSSTIETTISDDITIPTFSITVASVIHFPQTGLFVAL